MKSITIDRGKRPGDQPEKGHNRWHEAISPVVEAPLAKKWRSRPATRSTGRSPNRQPPRTCAAATSTSCTRRPAPSTSPAQRRAICSRSRFAHEAGFVRLHRRGSRVRVSARRVSRALYRQMEHQGRLCRSPDLPGVRIPDGSFVGVIGVAPSKELRETIQRREASLLGRGGMVLPPEREGAVPATEPIASEALRTVPPRENGGNLDIKQLSKGARLYLPVFAEGALFSVGDAHFAQGDGEACGTAIEMAGAILCALRCTRATPHGAASASRALPVMITTCRPNWPRPSAFSRRPECRSARTAPMRARTRSERTQRLAGDDRPPRRARLDPAAGLCDLQRCRRPQIERAGRCAEPCRQRLSAARHFRRLTWPGPLCH